MFSFGIAVRPFALELAIEHRMVEGVLQPRQYRVIAPAVHGAQPRRSASASLRPLLPNSTGPRGSTVAEAGSKRLARSAALSNQPAMMEIAPE